MASEIEDFGDIVKALALGYKFFGAGGFFGEKRRACKEFSLVAKITKALKPWTSTAEFGTLRPGWAGKLGDYPGGSWAAFDAGDAAAMQKAREVHRRPRRAGPRPHVQRSC